VTPLIPGAQKQIFLKIPTAAKQCQVVSVTFIATEWFFQLKKILKVFSTSASTRNGLVKSNR